MKNFMQDSTKQQLNRFGKVLIAAICVLGMDSRAMSAQNLDGTVRMHAAIVRAIRAEEPSAPYLLVYDANLSSVASSVAQLTGTRAVGRSKDGKTRAAGGDTISMILTVDSMGPNSAVVTVDSWGSLVPRDRRAPTTWFVRRRADVVLRGQEWIVTKLTTLLET